MLTASPHSFTDCLEFYILEPYGAAIGKYWEILILISPIQPTIFRPVFLTVGHMVPERATPSFYWATVTPEYATENSLSD
jgi:sorbitol-specific phosphotransferase system component IIC